MQDPYLLMTRAKSSHAQRSELENFERIAGNEIYPISCFGRVGDLNLFVGPNNSGKSRIMRQLFTRSAFLLDGEDAEAHVQGLLATKEGLHEKAVRKRLGNKFAHLCERVTALFDEPSSAFHAPKQHLLVRTNHGLRLDLSSVDPSEWNELLPEPPKLLSDVRSTGPLDIPLTESSAIPRAFVPTLRSTVRIGDSVSMPGLNDEGGIDIDSDPLAVSFVDSYGLGRGRYHLQPSMLTVFTGARLYELVSQQKGEALEVRRVFENFESFLGREFFGNKSVRLVPRNAAQKRHDVSGNLSPHVVLEVEVGDEAWAIQDLGDGVSSLITLLFPIFLQPEKSWIFIEEPENCLHPGLQRRFMEIAFDEGVKKRGHRLFITTHSNHVLEAARDQPGTRIFRVERRESEGVRKHTVEEVPPDSLAILDELGVSAASVLQARCAIWVEGPSDVRYLRGLLRLRAGRGAAQKQVLEGRDYVFVTYGGSLLSTIEGDDDGTALHETLPRIKSVAVKSLVVSDRDGPKKAETHTRREASYPSAGVGYRVTSAIEMENELGLRVWQAMWSKLKPGTQPSGTLPTENEFRGIRLGELEDRLFGTNRRAESGTLKAADKAKAASTFEEMVRRSEIDWDDLGPEAKKLAQDVFAFIEGAIPTNPAL